MGASGANRVEQKMGSRREIARIREHRRRAIETLGSLAGRPA
jgi:hypothetical protein